jgi:hypothetical protein
MTTMTAARPDLRRLELAVHEAAHAVIGVIHGARVQRVSLAADGATGRTDFTAGSFTTGSPVVYRTHIAAAGAVAEAMLVHGPRPTLRQIEARLCGSDRDELHQQAMASGFPVPIPAASVIALLSRCWAAIAELTPDLYFGRTLDHTDVCAAMGLRDEGGPHSVELAVIRSGAPR